MRRSLLGLITLCALSGCTSFAPRAGSPAAVAPQEFPRTVRLELRDGSRVELFQARIMGDTIRGVLANTSSAAVPTAAVARWEERRFAPLRTLVAVGSTAMMLGLLWAAIYEGPVDVLHLRPESAAAAR